MPVLGTPITRVNGTPEFQTVLAQNNAERDLVKDIRKSVMRHCKFKKVRNIRGTTNLSELVADMANLPLLLIGRQAPTASPVHMATGTHRSRNITGTMLFEPKFKGTVTSTEAGFLNDSSANFLDFGLKVRPGDIVAVVTDNVAEDGYDISAHTVVTDESTVAATRIQVDEDYFPVGTEYEIHWPIDMEKEVDTVRNAVLTLDYFADPSAAFGSGVTINEIEANLRSWLESDVAQVILQLNDAQTGTTWNSVDLSGLTGETYGSDLDHHHVDLDLVAGELTTELWPTIETVERQGNVTPHGAENAIVQAITEQTEDDWRIQP